MTAFSSSEIEADSLTLTCELRSVNHRYCDISLKIPERLRFAESDIRNAISFKLKRGKIECAINYNRQFSEQSFHPNWDAVQALLAAASRVEEAMGQAKAFSALDVLAFPGIQQHSELDRELLKERMVVLVNQALDNLLEARGREGAQLALLIDERCQKILQLAQQAELRMPEVLNQVRTKLKNRIVELVAEPNFDRLEQELVLLAQKLDVAEELDRLKTHVMEVQLALKQKDPVGRRLDFLMQEMNREANTLGSKSADKEMTQISIDLKVLIEQMREQIQNIE